MVTVFTNFTLTNEVNYQKSHIQHTHLNYRKNSRQKHARSVYVVHPSGKLLPNDNQAVSDHFSRQISRAVVDHEHAGDPVPVYVLYVGPTITVREQFVIVSVRFQKGNL